MTTKKGPSMPPGGPRATPPPPAPTQRTRPAIRPVAAPGKGPAIRPVGSRPVAAAPATVRARVEPTRPVAQVPVAAPPASAADDDFEAAFDAAFGAALEAPPPEPAHRAVPQPARTQRTSSPPKELRPQAPKERMPFPDADRAAQPARPGHAKTLLSPQQPEPARAVPAVAPRRASPTNPPAAAPIPRARVETRPGRQANDDKLRFPPPPTRLDPKKHGPSEPPARFDFSDEVPTHLQAPKVRPPKPDISDLVSRPDRAERTVVMENAPERPTEARRPAYSAPPPKYEATVAVEGRPVARGAPILEGTLPLNAPAYPGAPFGGFAPSAPPPAYTPSAPPPAYTPSAPGVAFGPAPYAHPAHFAAPAPAPLPLLTEPPNLLSFVLFAAPLALATLVLAALAFS